MKIILISFSELLPGIEDFLCKTLAGENLSEIAEQQRQYFVERLDILQLPPSVPPRSSGKYKPFIDMNMVNLFIPLDY